jgi:hypothetical protein
MVLIRRTTASRYAESLLHTLPGTFENISETLLFSNIAASVESQ